MFRFGIIWFFVICSTLLAAGDPAVLPEVLNPTALAVEGNYLYVVEETTVLVFNLTDHSLIKRFGKSGEGPMEFNRFVTLTPLGGKLWINSLGKLSLFSLMGEFLEVKKSPGQFRSQVLPLGAGYIGRMMQRNEESRTQSLVFFNADLTVSKKVVELPLFGMGGGRGGPRGGEMVFPSTPIILISNGRWAAISAWEGFKVMLIGSDGEVSRTIDQGDWTPPPLGAEDKKAYEASLKRRFGTRWERMKERIRWGETYPAVAELFFDGQDLVVTTWKRDKELTQALRYPEKGAAPTALWLPIRNQAPMERYPMALAQGRFYQLVENEDEEWALIVTPLG